jgi:hypothetical protein
MYDQKPKTSLMEDLQILGLVKQPRGRRRLSENEDEMTPDPSMASPDPDADEDSSMPHAQGGHPGAPPGAPPGGPQGGPPAPKTPPFPSNLPSGGPGAEDQKNQYFAPPADGMGDDGMDDDEEMAAYESAWNVVKQYYALNERRERLSEDDYKTVVNAMSFIIETQGKYLSLEPDHDPDELPGGSNPSWAGDSRNDPDGKSGGTNAFEKPTGWRYHDGSPRPSEKAESLSNLVGELRALTQQTESEDEMQTLGTKIIEGFEAIRDTSEEVAHGIASELRESREKVTDNNPRLRLGKYFEGVGGDARLLLRAISERHTTDVDDAIEDLNSLARDLKRGLAQL